MFLELGRVDSKVNRESGRIYNISGMPTGNHLIYAGYNRFPEFPIRLHGDNVSLGRAAGFRDLSAGPCRLMKTLQQPDRDRGRGHHVQAMDCTPEPSGPQGRGDQ